MNKIAKTMIFSLMAACTMISCEKSPALEGGEPDITASISGNIENAGWTGKESLALSANGDAVVVVASEKGESFGFKAAFAPTQPEGNLYAASPYDEDGESSWISLGADEARAIIPTSQKTGVKFCDASAMLMFAKTAYTGGIASVKSLDFAHVAAYAEIKVNNAPEPIEKATVKFAKKAAGEFVYAHGAGTWKETENSSDKLTVTANAYGQMILAAVPSEEQEIEIELTGAATGAKYSAKKTVTLAAGKVADITVDLGTALRLYIVGTAVGTEDAANAKPLTRNEDGSFSYTGRLAADSWYSFIFDKEHLTPSFSMGDAFNKVKYSTKASAAVFENKYEGNYTLTLYPAQAHLAVKRNFDHIIAAAGGADPMDENFDGERTFGPYSQDQTWNWNLGVIGINAVGKIVYGENGSGITINDEYKLCGANSLCLAIDDQAADAGAGDGQLYRNGNNKQPMAEWNKTYTVILQMLYEGEEETKKIPVICEGALGAVWDGTNEDGSYKFTKWETDMGVELQNGVPTLIQAQFLGNGAWGGCFNFYIRPAGTGANYKLYIDGLQIGYDD